MIAQIDSVVDQAIRSVFGEDPDGPVIIWDSSLVPVCMAHLDASDDEEEHEVDEDGHGPLTMGVLLRLSLSTPEGVYSTQYACSVAAVLGGGLHDLLVELKTSLSFIGTLDSLPDVKESMASILAEHEGRHE